MKTFAMFAINGITKLLKYVSNHIKLQILFYFYNHVIIFYNIQYLQKIMYFVLQAMMVCLESKDYVQIRNSLIILIKIVNHFPVLAKLATLIEKKVEKVREDEKDKRQDLYTLATSYCGLLKGRASQFLKDSDFHQVNEKVKQFLKLTRTVKLK